MKTGMLWFDNDPKANLDEKVGKAAAYYARKYGQRPNLCFVHPSMAPEEKPSRQGVSIRTNQTVLPNHFWIGVADS